MKKFSISLILLFTFQLSKAQLFVDDSYTVPQMIEDFFDTTGAVISNVTYSGDSEAVGFFDAGNTNLGINAGIMLTTGQIFLAIGPNNNCCQGMDNGAPGDADLTQLCGQMTFNASVIEFDIVPDGDTLSLKYVFGSDEYSEWVGTPYNDVFAFFLNGPGYVDSNIAVIPDTTIPVSISNINCTISAYGQYYVCNDPANYLCDAGYNCPPNQSVTTLQYDGFTTPLPIMAIVVPGETYHLKIAISDAGDGIYDSGVFLSIESLGGSDSLHMHASANHNDNGNDVNFIDKSKYASKWQWDFGDGNFSSERNPAHTYVDLANTGYLVKQKVSNFCCSDSVIFGVGNFLAVQNLLSNPLSVGPNPVINTLNINLKNGSSGEMYLYDAAGKLLLSKYLSGDAVIDVSSFAHGTYLLTYMDGKQVYRQKILKQ